MTDIFAHRGWSEGAPENTLTAFSATLGLGIDGIELDVQLTSDGQVVVIHDEKIDRTTNGVGWVKDLTYQEIRALDAGSWFSSAYCGVKVPLLQEVLELCRPQGCKLNIELKNGLIRYPGLEERVISLISNYPAPVVISSFNHQSLHQVRQLDSEIEVGILYYEVIHRPLEYAKTVGANALHPYYLAVDQELILLCQQAHLNLRPWTVDDPVWQERLLRDSVSGIITNKPDQLLALRNGQGSGSGRTKALGTDDLTSG